MKHRKYQCLAVFEGHKPIIPVIFRIIDVSLLLMLDKATNIKSSNRIHSGHSEARCPSKFNLQVHRLVSSSGPSKPHLARAGISIQLLIVYIHVHNHICIYTVYIYIFNITWLSTQIGSNSNWICPFPNQVFLLHSRWRKRSRFSTED